MSLEKYRPQPFPLGWFRLACLMDRHVTEKRWGEWVVPWNLLTKEQAQRRLESIKKATYEDMVRVYNGGLVRKMKAWLLAHAIVNGHEKFACDVYNVKKEKENIYVYCDQPVQDGEMDHNEQCLTNSFSLANAFIHAR